MKKFILLAAIVFFYTNLFAQGQIINVPGDQPTIQSAINSSTDGDTVLVADGTYFENINFRGKAITVASHFLIDGDETHIDSTIINGSQPSHPDSGSVVFIEDSKDSNSVLCGFTITGGTGTKTGFGELGGGIAIGFSGAKIEHNKIINNSTVHNGAGITIGYPQNPVIIRKNYIAHNIAKDTRYTNGGGGMMIAYDYGAYVLVTENVIEYNISYSSKGGGVGGGISMQHSNSVIRNNLIAKNIAYEGAGMHIHDGENPNKPTIINNTIVYNTASNEGGGLNVSWQNPSESPIRNCIIWGNTAPVGSQIFEYPGGYDVSVEYTNIEGGFEGNGNIDLDPLFADTTLYYLDPLSPCVDAGIPYSTFNDVEDPNNPGSPLFPSLGSLRNDMGTYGGNPKMFSNKVSRIINVPTDQPTIQSAINTSVDGDTVLVADGTYFENINFKGKAITVASHFLIDGDQTHIDSTIINGSQPSDPKNGTVVKFISGEDTTSVLYGLTITGGTGSFNNLADHYGGGGIAVGSSGGKILYNKIINNSINYSKAYGGGIVVEDPINNLIIKGNLIANNVLNSSFGRGGGIFCIVYNPGDRIYIIENIITNNSSYTFDGGGGISINGGNPIVMNNLIKINYGKYGGGVQYKNYMFDELGVDEIGMPKLNFVNNTVVNNKSDRYAGIHSFEGSIGNTTFDALHPRILNSIIWGNISNDNSQIHSDFIVEFSDIEGGFVGNGNIDSDPSFSIADSFFRLSANSPCIGAGVDSVEVEGVWYHCPSTDLLGNPRPNPIDKFVDIGANESEFLLVGIKGEYEIIPTSSTLSQNYPNPFNPSTTIKYSIPSVASDFSLRNVTLKVYDILGREIATLVNEKQKPEFYEVTWNASNMPSGVYFYKLQVGSFIETRKMILLR